MTDEEIIAALDPFLTEARKARIEEVLAQRLSAA